MKKIYFAIAAATAIVQMVQADYLNDSWGFKDFEANKIYKPSNLSVKAINKAIDEAHNSGGGTVIIPAGNLNANNPIIIKDNVKLKGTTKDGKKLTFIDANFDMGSGKRALIISYQTTNTTVEDLNLDLKGHNLTAISYVEGNQHNFLIANNVIKNAGFVKYEVAKANGILPAGHKPVDGISMHDWGTQNYSTNFTIRDNYIENYSEHGVNLHYVREFVIDNNTMKNGMMGVDISTGSREGEILNNEFFDVVAGAKIIGNGGAYNQDIYFHNNYSHDNPKVTYHDDVSGETYDDGGRGLERQFSGKGIHIYDNVLKGHAPKYDILYFSGASREQDDVYGNNERQNPIIEPTTPKPPTKPTPTDTDKTKLGIGVRGDNVVFSINGNIEDGSHVQFFIDADNNPNTGYSNGTIKGADYVIEDDHLMKSTQNSTNWKWKVIKWGLKTTQSSDKASVKVPAKICDLINEKQIDIKITGSTINKKWQRTSRKYYGTKSYQFDLRPPNEVKPTLTPEPINSKAYIPKLDFSKNDIYGNGQVVYVANNSELKNAIDNATPKTTIILKDGNYRDLHVVFPKGKNHITIKSQNRHKAKITPRGNNDDAAFYLPAGVNENEINHHINFIDLEVSGGGQFVRSPDASYRNAHHIYILGVKMQGLWMGLYSGLSSHDWTVDGCEFSNSKASYMWYMMGYHHSVINSKMHNNSYYSLAIRGCYPLDEKFYEYNRQNNKRISSRSKHFLAKDDWTHFISNNKFGSNHNYSRPSNAHIGLYYNADEGEKVSEDVYFPPKNVTISNNAFEDDGDQSKIMLNLMANRGVNKGTVTSVNGLFIKNNTIDKSKIIDADTDISSVDLSSNHILNLQDVEVF